MKEIHHFIFERYKISLPLISKQCLAKKEDTFKTYIKTTVEQYPTYVLVDKVKNAEYFIGTNHDEMDPDEECARIVSLMVLEKDVFVGPEKIILFDSLLMYIFKHADKRYATKMLKMVFEQDLIYNKVANAVTKLPNFHIPSFGKMKIESDNARYSARMQDILKLPTNDSSGVFQRFKFTTKKYFDDIVDQCDGLIYEGSEHMRTNAVSIRTNGG